MIGAIIGDIVGSKYEFNNLRSKNFPFFDEGMSFTDDTVMTVAVFDALNSCHGNYDNLNDIAIQKLQEYGKKYPHGKGKVGYGELFREWIKSDAPKPLNSFGNGAAMRISSIAYFAKDLNMVKDLSRKVTEITHNHVEGLKGAEAVSTAIFMALHGNDKDEIKKKIERNFYSLDFEYDKLVKEYKYYVSCQRTVPQALYSFFISNSFEDAIRTGISIGGDSDTLCAIIGGVAGAYYGIPNDMKQKAYSYLDDFLLSKVKEFDKMFSEVCYGRI